MLDYILPLYLITGSQHNGKPYLKIINYILEFDAVQFDRQVSEFTIISIFPPSKQILYLRLWEWRKHFPPKRCSQSYKVHGSQLWKPQNLRGIKQPSLVSDTGNYRVQCVIKSQHMNKTKQQIK